MKKRTRKIFTVLFVLLIAALFTMTAFANDNTDDETRDAIVKADELLSQNTFSDMLSDFTEKIAGAATGFAETFALMMFLTFMLGIMKTVSAANIAVYAGEICLCTFSFSVAARVLENVNSWLLSLENFMLATLPVMNALYTSSGAVSTAATSYGSTIISLNVCNTVFTSILIPGIKCIVFLAVMSFVSRSFDFSGVSAFLKNTLGWMFGLLMCVMSAVIAFQNVIAVSKDGIMGRTVRFAASRFIPVIGNTVSESARTLSESLKLVRSVSGVAGIFAIIGLIASPIAALLVCRFFVNLCNALAKLFGEGKAAAFFAELSGVMNLLLGVTIGVSLVFILILGMFAKTSISL